MKEMKERYDAREYSKESGLYDAEHQKVIGKVEDAEHKKVIGKVELKSIEVSLELEVNVTHL